jgi:hypothetical protein
MCSGLDFRWLSLCVRACVCVSVCCHAPALVASALSNAGVRAKIYVSDDVMSAGTDAPPVEVSTHPAIISVNSLDSLFSGGVEGFPAKVRTSLQYAARDESF